MNSVAREAALPRRNYLLGLHDFSDWECAPGEKIGEWSFLSPRLCVPVKWDEMVPSWNATLPADAKLTIEARVVYKSDENGPSHTTKYFVMANWSGNQEQNPWGSVKNQKDEDGNVDTDTLRLTRRGGALQLRFTFRCNASEAGQSDPRKLGNAVRFVGLSFLDRTTEPTKTEPNTAAWGKLVPIPERFQFDYKDLGGAVWCSPTSVSMVLAYWSEITNRPELTMTVPHVAAAVLDHVWPGNGNWSFNAAFAGSFAGIRAYVARFDDLSEVETWIAAGYPVTLSVDYGLLKGKSDKTGGHLVVCVGFTENGDVVIADPGQHTEPGEKYRVFSRENTIAGWGASRNTVYLIYPETMVPPVNTLQHWQS